MGAVDATAEYGAFFNYGLSKEVMFTSSLRNGVDTKGSLLNLGIGYSTQVAPQWRVSTGIGVTWSDSDYLQTNFGVTSKQAASTGYAVYHPSDALRDVRIAASVAYHFDPKVSVIAGVSASSLSDEIRKSPLVRKADNVSVLLAVTYSF